MYVKNLPSFCLHFFNMTKCPKTYVLKETMFFNHDSQTKTRGQHCVWLNVKKKTNPLVFGRVCDCVIWELF